MSTLLIRNISQLVTCDDGDRVLQNADLYCEDGFIKAIGTALDISADEVIDGSHMLCYPGLVNTHHHLYQVFSRNLPQVQNMELFDWLKTLYEIWKNLDAEVIRLSSLTGMGELMKHGCTTCFDHHYVFPAGSGESAKGEARQIAREETACTLDDVCAAAQRVLRYGGRFTLVHRAERLADVLCAMRSHGIEPKRLRFLAKSPDAAPSLLFVEGKRGGKSGLVIEAPLVPNGEEWDAVYFRK